ncbi:MAG: T9SS type A sorting domain-containing protein [Bacteroidetes bacterium]|nr:T9SS type A sorting domain-containing protein [Bacteroidota bacterium]
MQKYLFILLFVSFNLFAQVDTVYYLNHGDIIFPIRNNGILADAAINDSMRGMYYNNKRILFSSGFYLSGYNNNKLWANGVASAARNEDYLPGSYKHPELNDLATIYVVRLADTPFGESWQNWKNAVKLGADFHDGDNDGVYNPIDRNGNNKWDYNEDRPDLIGNETVWCVYRDAVPGIRRRITGNPLGIDIQQTVFTTVFKNVIFVRYRIENTGIVTNLLDSVYFGTFSDPDIGDYNDDLLGCDTTLNAAFAYQNSPDKIWGKSAPTMLISILQGPAAFIPNVTFNDLNDNGIFDESDVSLSSAFEVNGFVKGTSEIKGAQNRNATSFKPYYLSHNGTSEPYVVEQYRNNMLGYLNTGEKINACDWQFGEVFNEDCNNINGLFPYSGDPVIPQGWINTVPNDVRMMLNTGPFQLKRNEPIDIIVAFVVGYNATSSLSSLQNAKKRLIDLSPYFYNNELDIIAIGDTTHLPPEPVYLFGLKQNFPNPFNSTTQIGYAIPYSENPQNVSIKVYNVLGQVVETLVNEVQSDGIYNIEFSSGDLPSGVYIIFLNHVGYSDTIKLMLLK